MRGKPTKSRTLVALGASLALLLAAACSGDDDDSAGGAAGAGHAPATEPDVETPYAGYESEVYAGDANWLCKPGRDDVCARDLDATVVAADGSTEVEQLDAADDPPVDCFYVYPTTSRDAGPSSDLEPAEGEEISTAYNQVARMTSVCRVFAPMYRQGTLSAIGGGGGGGDGANPMADAYGDVLDAFEQFIENESDGRPFVLIGHSQGASHLSRLVAEEIDDEPLLRDRLVSALLLGWPVSVPEGEVAGGAFENVPLCQATDQTGCVVSYSSFRSTAPPPAGSLFGRAFDDGGQAACVNPARPEGGGPAVLHPYFVVEQAEGSLLGGQSAQPFADPEGAEAITTPFVTYPDLVEAECVTEDGYTYLSLTVQGDPADPRTDDIGGDLTPTWGMHLVDVNVAMGDLVDLVAKQSEAFAASGS